MATNQVTVTANKFDPNSQQFVSAPTPEVKANTTVPTAEQNLASYNATKTTPAMNASNIAPANPITVVSPQPNNDTYKSAIDSTVTDLTTNLNTAKANVDAINAKGKQQAGEIADLQTLLGNKSADTQQIYNEQGVTDAYNQLVDLNAEATSLKNEASAIPIQIQNEFKGTGATDAGVAPVQSARLRDNALKALSLGQQAAIASAKYDKAKNYADMIVDAKYAKIQSSINAKLTNLQALKDFDLTPAQEKQRQAQEEKTKAEQAQLDQKKNLEKNINDVLITLQQNNAPASVIKAVQSSGSMGEAITNAGTYLATPQNEIVKLGDNQAYLIDKKTGKVIRSFGGGGGSVGGGSGNGYNITTNANGSYNITGTTANTQAYAGVLNTILGSSKFTKEQKADLINAVKNGQDPATVFKNQAKNILTGANQTKLENYETARDSLNSIGDQLKQFYANGGKTSLFNGTYEKAINNLGEVSDPKLVELATQIAASLQIYRNAVSGTAYSVQEGRDIASIFPGINKTQGLNDAILAGRKKAFEDTIDSTYRGVLGDGYDALKSIQTQKQGSLVKGTQTDREYVENVLSSKGLKYDTVVNYVLDQAKAQNMQQPMPVIDNATGLYGAIPYNEYLQNKSKYTPL
jgi:hypothetical protein